MFKLVRSAFNLYLLCIIANIVSFNSFEFDKRPNFVFIISEDNSYDHLKLYNKAGANTPNIEGLATHGLIFNNDFSNAAVCSTARTTLATGRMDLK